MNKVLLNGLHHHYQQTGKGPDITLIHGLTGDLSLWYVKFVPALSKSSRVTTYDLRGHGLSDRSATGYTPSELAEDLKALLDHLGVERTILVGHSYGGVIASAFAAHNPEYVRGLVLYDTGFPMLRRIHDYENWSGWEKWKTELDVMGITRETNLEDPDVAFAKLAHVPLPFGLRSGRLRIGRRLRKLLKETSLIKDCQRDAFLTEERLLAISVPMLGVYGGESPVANVGRFLADNLPNCRTVFVHGEDHFFALREPKHFLKLVIEFSESLAEEPCP